MISKMTAAVKLGAAKTGTRWGPEMGSVPPPAMCITAGGGRVVRVWWKGSVHYQTVSSQTFLHTFSASMSTFPFLSASFQTPSPNIHILISKYWLILTSPHSTFLGGRG